ncbi:MAG: AMP-dependent synthetase/ligase [Gemmataceae bacterium]
MSYRNLVELHRVQAERLGPRPAIRHKVHGLYRDLSWHDYFTAARCCAAALIEVGIKPGDRVGLLAENRLEWLIADMGLMAAGAVNVPPHAPLTAAQIQYQLADAGVRWLFVSTAEQLAKVQQIRHDLPDLQGVVVFDAHAAGAEARSWRGFLHRGRQQLRQLITELERREAALDGDSLATIMYTSGTTGQPKGVMLTHDNLLSNAVGTLNASHWNPNALQLNWLPLSHIYARTVDHYLSIAGGHTLALAENADTLVLNLKETQPTNFNSVPRFYEKVLNAVSTDDPAQLGRRLRGIFGARIDFLNSGGAPLPLAVAEAFHRAGLLLLQGYGLTESSPVITFNRKDHYKLGTVGQAIPGVEVAIAPDGEVLTRGPHVMKGYWNNPQATAEAIRDGWLYTGDLGQLDAEGFLTITGRKKELLVLSNGKKVVPNHIEGLLLADECVDQVMVCGEGRNFLTALIVPHWDNLRRVLDQPLHQQPPETLAQHPQVYEVLQARLNRALRDVAPWEQVKKFLILPHPFSVAAEELTVSLKLRRNVVLEHYGARLEELYREG